MTDLIGYFEDTDAEAIEIELCDGEEVAINQGRYNFFLPASSGFGFGWNGNAGLQQISQWKALIRRKLPPGLIRGT